MYMVVEDVTARAITQNTVDTENETTANESTPKSLSKREIKQQAKAIIRKKFYIGETYYLKSSTIKRQYILKKYIYAIRDDIVNIVIMKQISGPIGKIYTLTPHDCLNYHIKYEPGLQVFSMSLNWVHRKKNKNEK